LGFRLAFDRSGPRRSQAQAGKPDAEERAAPFVHEGKRGVSASFVDGFDEVRGRVSRARERGSELGMDRLDPGGRCEPVGALAGGMQPVLEPAQLVEGILVVQLHGVRRELFELGERPGKPTPKRADLCRVSLPDTPNRSHGLNPNRIRSCAVGEGRPFVLIVEDDPSLRLLCRMNLELEQFRVGEAATIDAARAVVAEGRPDVVLLDVHLGGVASDQLLDELRAAGIPVVVVTGAADLNR
jgi:hypothetical protein